MKNFKRYLLLSILSLCLFISGCGERPTVESVIADGAKEFGQGKTEQDQPFISSEQLLNNLITEYSDSRSDPTGSQMSDDEADKVRREAKKDADGDTTGGGSSDGASGADPSGGGGSEDTVETVASHQDLKDLMHEMLDGTEEVASFRVDGGYQVTTDEILSAYRELERDDPMDVHSVGSFSYGGNPIVTLKLNYDLDVDLLIRMKEETRGLLKQAESQINVDGLSQYEIVCAVNDYLCDTIVYPPSEPYPAETHTPHSALKDGSAVCDGYAKTAKLMLNDFGVECDFIIGTCTNGGGHAWNLVKLDGEWYHMDVTWNDGGAQWDKNARTAYLLVTDQYMLQSRTWDAGLYPASAAKAYKKGPENLF